MLAETKSTELDHTINYVVMNIAWKYNDHGSSIKPNPQPFSLHYFAIHIQNTHEHRALSITMTSKTAAGPSVPGPSRQVRNVPPEWARCFGPGHEYSEYGDLYWRLHGQPDGTAPRDKINPDLTREEGAEAYMGTVGFRTRLC
jgi:hypothetical protein